MESARRTLGAIGRLELRRMPDSVRQIHRQLTVAVVGYFEIRKQQDSLQAGWEAIESQCIVLERMLSSGRRQHSAQAAPLAERLLAEIQRKYPAHPAATAGARLMLAEARLAEGNVPEARLQWHEIRQLTPDEHVEDLVQFGWARLALREYQTDAGVSLLRALSEGADAAELRREATARLEELAESTVDPRAWWGCPPRLLLGAALEALRAVHLPVRRKLDAAAAYYRDPARLHEWYVALRQQEEAVSV
jgi:predicted negative regulator of RcsB-dependent stress response